MLHEAKTQNWKQYLSHNFLMAIHANTKLNKNPSNAFECGMADGRIHSTTHSLYSFHTKRYGKAIPVTCRGGP
jgi:hypothetical protein